MSSELVRQALAFVDPEEKETKKRKRLRANQCSNSGQNTYNPYKRQNKKSKKEEKSQGDIVEINIKKLLALSATASNPAVAQKIVQRAVKGKPLLEKVEKTVEKEQSILFPEEAFESFEKTYFCK